jgi:hypothetical protein
MNLCNPTGSGRGWIRTTPWQVIGVWDSSYRQRGRGSRRRRVGHREETKTMTSSSVKRNGIQAGPAGSWAESMGHDQVSYSPFFLLFFFLSIICF